MSSDTSSAAQAHLDALYRRMSAQQKVRRALGLSELTHTLALSELRRQHPEADAETLGLTVAERRIEPELFQRYRAWREARR